MKTKETERFFDTVEDLSRMYKEDDEERTAGGAGSGNFGHEGRPGEVGGSGGGGESMKVGMETNLPSPTKEMKATQLKVQAHLSKANFPEGTLDGLGSVNVTDNILGNDEIVGWYDGWGSNRGNILISGADPENAVEVLHEVGHHVHLSKLSDESSKEWSEISNKGNNCRVSSYGRTNTGEHFAEAFQKFSLGGANRARLGKLEPKTHAFMARLWKNPSYSSHSTSDAVAKMRYKGSL